MTIAPPLPPSTLRRDLVTAYLASGAKVASWLWVTGFLFRMWGEEAVAVFAMARATLGVLAYATLGLGPAMVYFLAKAVAPKRVETIAELDATAPPDIRNSAFPDQPPILSYRTPPPPTRRFKRLPADEASTVFSNGLLLSLAFLMLALPIAWALAPYFPKAFNFADIPRDHIIVQFVFAMAFGVACRLASDTAGAVIQVRGYIWIDNLLIVLGEALWIFFIWLTLDRYELRYSELLVCVGSSYALSGLAMGFARLVTAAITNGPFRALGKISSAKLIPLLSYGTTVMIGQVADFLYAPTNFILINLLMGATTTATYLPAIQIDAGLLLLVSALATVLLPRAAVAHAADDRRSLRQYYLRGTLTSFALLATAAVMIWLLSPFIFRLWLGDDMPATRAILPLVLIHTVAGGSAMVGRSILIGTGRAKAFTIAVLIAGVLNVLLGYLFVTRFGWGLNGIILATIIAVVGRCILWQPWYVWRCLSK